MENLQPGTMLQNGKFRIVSILGQGGFGITYLAEHTMLAKKFAIKEFFPKDFCNRDEATAQITVGTQSKKALVEKLKRKFTDEARALCRLSHPGIVSVTDVFEENGTAYFVMDYIEGRSLSDMLKIESPMSEERAVGYIRQIAMALQYVHNNNRLHLDVKPANIMVDKNDHAVLIDFGASKQYDEESGENTSTLMGKTPGYAPIEQMGNNVQKFAPATDIYALGATLYKLLTGVTPPSSADLAGGEELMPLPPSVSKGVKYAIAEAMEIRITKRPQSMAAFLALLNPEKSVSDDENTIVEDEKTKIVEGGEMPPIPPVPPVKGGDLELDGSDQSDKPQTFGNKQPQPRKKSPWKLITFSTIGLAAIIALVLIFAGGGNSDGPENEVALMRPDNSISDTDSILTEEQRLSLIHINDSISQTSGNQIVTMIIKNSNAQDFKLFNDSVFNAWGIGDKEKNNGILIGIDIENHRVALSAGSGFDDPGYDSEPFWQSVCSTITTLCKYYTCYEGLKMGALICGGYSEVKSIFESNSIANKKGIEMLNEDIARNMSPRSLYDKGKKMMDSENCAMGWPYVLYAAQKGYARAQQEAGSMYWNGHIGPEDVLVGWSKFSSENNKRRGYDWYEKAAEQNDAHSQLMLGDAYLEGLYGFPCDTFKAVQYYKKAQVNGKRRWATQALEGIPDKYK